MASEVIQGIIALSAFGAFVLSVISHRKIQEIHVQINSRMDQLLREVGQREHALGKLQEKAEEQIRQDDRTK